MTREVKKLQQSVRRERSTGTQRVLSTDEKGVDAGDSKMRQPDERDQSADQQGTAPRNTMKQAHDDVQSGQQDTDCRNRVAEILPDVPKTSRNFDAADKEDAAPHVAETKQD